LLTFAIIHNNTTKKIKIMGRVEKRTKNGKITIGSFGKSRLARTVRKATPKAEKKD
jgi:ribosomal small subunit protein bTHX